ncbi:MAG: NUDIX hydrolase [Erysipelotrichia bacterium]|nr:NUDIX hydrolase [Erysipelotrichia bacterium]
MHLLKLMNNNLKDNKGLTLEQFLEIYKTKNYSRPYLTADCLIYSLNEGEIYLLLIRRKGHPYINQWAIPGGFAQENEDLKQTAQRELFEETGLNAQVTLLDIYSARNRDPRGWIVSATYYGLVDKNKVQPRGQDDAKEAQWFQLFIKQNMITLAADNYQICFDSNGTYNSMEQLAFDHQKMIIDFLIKKKLIQ